MLARRFFQFADGRAHESVDSSLGLSPVFLRFAPAIQARFERDTGADRCSHLRRSIVFGLLFYNAYNISDLLLIPDMAMYSSAARLLLMTPIALAIVSILPKLKPAVREAVITLAMIGVAAVPVLFLALSRAPFSGYTLAEVPLVLVYGGMMLVLRVDGAALFTLASALFTTVAIAVQPAFVGLVAGAMMLQLITACAFVLYGNRQIEWVRRAAYLAALRETLRSEELEEVKLRLTALTITDALTGLANRRAFDETMSLYEVAGRDIALVMIDIDYFKPFNDTYGHAAGDSCIKLVAAALAKASRPEKALVARFGGEEFAVVVENEGQAPLEAMMHRMCAEVRALRIPHDARPDGKSMLTISAGGTTRLLESGTCRALIDLADVALYDAKKHGRDCYRVARIGRPSHAA